MAGLMRSFGRMSAGVTRGSAYRDAFIFSEMETDISSGVHVATFVDGEWEMIQTKGLVFTYGGKLPSRVAVDLVYSNGKWRVCTDDKRTFVIPDGYVFEQTHDGEIAHVLMIPSAYDVRYRSTLVRLVGVIGKTGSGSIILISLDPKKFDGATEFEAVSLETFWYDEEKDKVRNAPSYAPPIPEESPNPTTLNLSEAKALWFNMYNSEFNDDDRNNIDEYGSNQFQAALVQRILFLEEEVAKMKLNEEEEEEEFTPAEKTGFEPLVMKTTPVSFELEEKADVAPDENEEPEQDVPEDFSFKNFGKKKLKFEKPKPVSSAELALIKEKEDEMNPFRIIMGEGRDRS